MDEKPKNQRGIAKAINAGIAVTQATVTQYQVVKQRNAKRTTLAKPSATATRGRRKAV